MLITELMQEASPDTMKSWLTILEPYFSKMVVILKLIVTLFMYKLLKKKASLD